MKSIPKKHLMFWVFTAAAIILTFFLLKKDLLKSSISITGNENKFFVNLNLKSSDQKNFEKLLANLEIPKNILDSFSFELDSTSSASLAYITPIKLNPKIKDKSISFSGQISRSPFSRELSAQKIKIPKDYTLATLAPNVLDFVLKRNSYPEHLAAWIETNFNKETGQYLIILRGGSDFVALSQNIDSDLEGLKNVYVEKNLEAQIKEETQNDTSMLLINLENGIDKGPKTIALFKLDDEIVLASSREAALRIIEAQKSSNFVEFPKEKINQDSTFILRINSAGESQNSDIASYFFKDTENISKSLDKISEINLALKGKEISGLIILK